MTPSRIAAAVSVVVLAASVAVALAATRAGGGDAVDAARASAPQGGSAGAGAGSSGSTGAVAASEPMSLPVVSSDPVAPADPGEPPQRGITVTGSAVVEAAPDQSEWSFGVQEQGETARQALDRASEAANRLVAALRREGIGERDLRTEQVSVWPNHDGRGISGYVASTSVHVLVRDVERAGRVVDAAVSAGANQVSGPNLSSSDRDAVYRQALAAALQQARANAQALAREAGAELGGVVAIRESGSAPPPVHARMAPAVAEDAAAVPIEPGRQQIGATVTVTFALGG
ncbi:MAG TPA: SIMPL domain-containing protein [Gaiellaceae bacterium]|nr:SIMPL domain-containing protein [Gaiellaceae bacterium]